MSATRRLIALGLAVSLAVTVPACGGGDDAADDLAEKIAEEASGGDVDVDSEDGTVKYTDEEGNVSELNVDGEGATLPDDWPEELAPPESVKLLTATTNTTDGVMALYVLGEAEGTVDEYFEAIKGQVEDAGYEITNESNLDGESGAFSTLSATGDSWELSANVAEGQGDGTVSITMGLTELAS